jgi:FkbM family methyltransferase
MKNLQKATSADLRHAYRLLLGREPDPAGFAHFEKYIERSEANASDIGSLFLASSEFKRRQVEASRLDEIVFDGLKLYPWRGDRLIGDAIKESEEYEAHVLPLFVESVPVGGTVLDIGANIGVFTLSAARKAGERGRIFSIEPVPNNVQSLCAGVIGNSFRNVTILPVAASDAPGVVAMLRNSNSSNGIIDTHVEAAVAESFVPAQRLDFLLAGLDSLDVVKIDIEGHEPLAWSGIEALVRKHKPVVFTEFNPPAIRNHSRIPPEQYLDALFGCAGEIAVLHLDGRRVRCTKPQQVMGEWREANRRMNAEEIYHLDLLLDTRAW